MVLASHLARARVVCGAQGFRIRVLRVHLSALLHCRCKHLANEREVFLVGADHVPCKVYAPGVQGVAAGGFGHDGCTSIGITTEPVTKEKHARVPRIHGGTQHCWVWQPSDALLDFLEQHGREPAAVQVITPVDVRDRLARAIERAERENRRSTVANVVGLALQRGHEVSGVAG